MGPYTYKQGRVDQGVKVWGSLGCSDHNMWSSGSMEKGTRQIAELEPWNSGEQTTACSQGPAWNNHMDYDTRKKSPGELFDFSSITSSKLKNGLS